MKRLKTGVIGVLICCLLMQPVVKAREVWETIDILKNFVTFRINDRWLEMDSFEYNNRTYASVKETLENVGYSVSYNADTKVMNLEEPWAKPVDEKKLLGRWVSVDIVSSVGQFDPNNYRFKGDLFLEELEFLKNGTIKNKPYYKWVDDVILKGSSTAEEFMITNIQGQDYLFMEWKSGDYTIRKDAPVLYVFMKQKGLSQDTAYTKKVEAKTKTVISNTSMSKLDSAYFALSGKLYDDAGKILGADDTALYVDNNNKLYTESLEVCNSFLKIINGDYIEVNNSKKPAITYLVVNEDVPYEYTIDDTKTIKGKTEKALLTTIIHNAKSITYRKVEDKTYKDTYSFYNESGVAFSDYSSNGGYIRLYSIDDYLNQLGLEGKYAYYYDKNLNMNIISFK